MDVLSKNGQYNTIELTMAQYQICKIVNLDFLSFTWT